MSLTKIAVMGFGVVGSGTVELFYKNKDLIEKRCGHEMDIKYILDLRDFPDSPFADKLTKNFDDILNDDEVKVVCELWAERHLPMTIQSAFWKRGRAL